MQSKRLKIN
ncbi:hypothetical protein TGPRC2_267960A, partial [Toxoplasma gondii TgCatPRC2]